MSLAVEARAISRRFGALTAVDRLSLAIEAGTIYGFLGPNGSGKSTSIRLLTGLLVPSDGDIRVLGLDIPRQAEALKRRIGYMTQRFALYDDLSVRENLAFMASIYGLRRAEAAARIAQLLDDYELAPQAGLRAGQMSGGQRQRLALACAVLHRPELLFLDEPTSAVDPENRRQFWEKLFDLCDQGTTILVSSHYMDEAERCHRLAILAEGRLCAEGPPQQLMDRLGASVVEVEAGSLRALKARLLALPQVRSCAQLGLRLRVLVDSAVEDPLAWLRRQLPELGSAALARVRPSLEDVFVVSTGSRPL